MRNTNSPLRAAIAAAMSAGLGAAANGDPLPIRGLPRARKTYKPNGERECARRRRQIASGMLKVTG